jgi:hypothetical protein
VERMSSGRFPTGLGDVNGSLYTERCVKSMGLGWHLRRLAMQYKITFQDSWQ